MLKIYTIYFLVLTVALSSCATAYRPLNVDRITGQQQGTDLFEVAYRPAPLKGQYAKRQYRSLCSMIAVRITNNSSHPIVPANDLKIFKGDAEVMIMSTDEYHDLVSQNPRRSMAFLGLLPANYYDFKQTTHGDEVTDRKTTFIPVGLILGPALAFGNQAAAKSANRKFRKDLESKNIAHRSIPPGETVEGILCLYVPQPEGLVFKSVYAE